jgi:putative DNA primase/helicase
MNKPEKKEKGISAKELNKAAKEQLQEQGLSKEVSSVDKEIPEGRFPEKIIYQALDENEDGDAALFIKLFQGHRLYDQRVNPLAAWYYWNDHHWREDEQKEVFKLVREVVGVYYEQHQREIWKIKKAENNKKLSAEERDTEIKYCKSRIKILKEREKQLQTLKRKSSILKLASMGVNSLGYVGDGWDLNPWLIGCRNGVIDLEKGQFRDGRPEDYIKTVSPIAWDENATCPAWERFLLEIFEGDQEMVDFMQRLLGYAITGLREEHIYPIFWGEHGRNGKGTILETLKIILGLMAYRAPTQLVMQGIKSTGTGPNATLMKFRGARIVWTSEANKKDHLDTAIVKGLSGGDTISARNPFDRKETDFPPTHTIITVVNPLPKVDADDDAFWDRVILIPFSLSFVDKPDPLKPWQRLKNPKLGEELKKEAPGILKWLVQGTSLWIKDRLNIPESLLAAKHKYREEEDIIGYFFEECCFIEKGNTSLRTKPKELYFVYKSWCKESGFNHLNQKHFKEAILKKIEPPSPYLGCYYYKGIILTINPGDAF